MYAEGVDNKGTQVSISGEKLHLCMLKEICLSKMAV